MLLALNSFDIDTDISNHPQLIVIFNNVSWQEENEISKLRVQDRIDQYKLALKANAKLFYLSEVSDDTVIGEKTWAEVKDAVLANESHKSQAWFSALPKDKRELVVMLKDIQKRGESRAPLKPQPNPQMEKLIETRGD